MDPWTLNYLKDFDKIMSGRNVSTFLLNQFEFGLIGIISKVLFYLVSRHFVIMSTSGFKTQIKTVFRFI